MALIEIHIGLPHSNKKLQCYRFPPPWIAECSPSYVAIKQMGNLYNFVSMSHRKLPILVSCHNHNQQQQGRSRVSARILHTYVHRCHFWESIPRHLFKHQVIVDWQSQSCLHAHGLYF